MPDRAPHIGVQVGAHSVFDEGPQHVIDTLQDTCRANALHVYAMNSHRYAPWFVASNQSLTAEDARVDHGCDFNPRPTCEDLTSVWFQSHERYYAKPEHAPAQPHLGYGDRDVFDELAEPAARAGVQLYARFCDWGNVLPFIPDMIGWAVENPEGIRQPYLCPNNPDYQRWTRGLMEDIFREHPYLAGLNFGLERGAPLMGVMGGGKGDCFCEHCCALGERTGVDPERVRAGFRALNDWSAACRSDRPPSDGAFVAFFRILRSYPDVLAWDKQMTDGWFRLCKDMYATIKAIDPAKEAGWHIFQHLSFNPFFRSMFDCAEMDAFSDWLKPVLYHNCSGERMKSWAVQSLGQSVFADVPEQQLVPLLYRLLGYDEDDGPSWAQINEEVIPAFKPAFVRKEVERLVRSSSKPVLAGIGLDIPSPNGEPCAPENAYAATTAAFAGGASGLVISREYDEMQLDHLAAVGRAVDASCGVGTASSATAAE